MQHLEVHVCVRVSVYERKQERGGGLKGRGQQWDSVWERGRCIQGVMQRVFVLVEENLINFIGPDPPKQIQYNCLLAPCTALPEVCVCLCLHLLVWVHTGVCFLGVCVFVYVSVIVLFVCLYAWLCVSIQLVADRSKLGSRWLSESKQAN